MKLFKCHAVLPLIAHERTHVVRTYVTSAETWQEARLRVRAQETTAEFITIPSEMPDVLMIDVSSMSQRELADLRSACGWNEDRLINGSAPAAGRKSGRPD
ncbi:MAG TPA: hypothetical protein VEN29_09125 [Casimicrobiaceae bacterium]|nr:hypothetical protein [Casimicrobiaceae bacterium]